MNSPEDHPFIPLSAPRLGGNEWKYVKECLDTGWVSSVGPFVERFENTVSRYTGSRYAVAVVNGTAALHTALLVVGVKPGDEVLVPNLTFIAPVNAIFYARAHPVLMDADPQSWQMDIAKVIQFLETECEIKNSSCINKKTGRIVRAILPVHLLGLACEIDRLLDVARKYYLKVVEDAAEAIGVRYQGRHVGTFGDAGALSFNGNKVITTGGGGMVLTHDKGYADAARYLTTQAKDDPLEYIHNEIGYNYRLTNIQAAIGVAQLEQLDTFLARKRAIASCYEEAFHDLVGKIGLMPKLLHCDPTYWLYTVLLKEGTSLEKRKRLIRYLNQNGIGARPFWHTIHDLPPYKDCQAYRIEHSVRLYERGVCLPSSVGLTTEELQKIVFCFKEALAEI